MAKHEPQQPAAEAVDGSSAIQLAVWISIGTLALIVAIIMLARFAVNAYGSRSIASSPAMSAEAVAKRIGPVAALQLEGAAPVAAAPSPAAAPAKVAAAPGKVDGKKVYDTACAACHVAGVAGAPKFGDKAAWAPRVKTGADALYASAIKGKGAMPAKGGNAALSDAEVKAAVDVMLASVK